MKQLLRWVGVLCLGLVPVAQAQLQVQESKQGSGKYAELDAELRAEGILEEFAAEVNAAVALPAPVGIRYAECGQVNAFYSPGEKQISMCYELIEHFVGVMAQEFPDEEQALDAAGGAFAIVLFHELGHALVDVMELPITGREEDAVDQLSAWAMIDSGAGDEAVLNAALSYYRSAERNGGQIGTGMLAGEHSLSIQRFYNLLCWVYGSNPEKYQGLVGDTMLPASRAERCPSEYAQIDRSWTALLSAE